MSKIKLHELTGSPNSVKVRIALGYKRLEYDRKALELESYPGDRSEIARLSRQPRLPMIEDGKTVIFGSDGILRYLEANYSDTPPLFSEDYATFGEIEQWETFSRTQLGEPIGMLFGQALAPRPDLGVVAKANKMINDRTGVLEDKLSTGEFLLSDHLTAGDIACAAPLYLADMSEDNAKSHPISAFFGKNVSLGLGREKTRAWVRRVMKYDAVKGRR